MMSHRYSYESTEELYSGGSTTSTTISQSEFSTSRDTSEASPGLTDSDEDERNRHPALAQRLYSEIIQEYGAHVREERARIVASMRNRSNGVYTESSPWAALAKHPVRTIVQDSVPLTITPPQFCDSPPYEFCLPGATTRYFIEEEAKFVPYADLEATKAFPAQKYLDGFSDYPPQWQDGLVNSDGQSHMCSPSVYFRRMFQPMSSITLSPRGPLVQELFPD